MRVQWRIQDLWKGGAGNPISAMPRQAWKSRSGGGGGGGDSGVTSKTNNDNNKIKKI